MTTEPREDLTTPPPPILNHVLATVELMGKRIYIAFASEVFIAGAPFLRLDIPLPGGHSHAYFIGAQSIYGVSPMGAGELTESARVANENTLAYAGLLSPAERARFDQRQVQVRTRARLELPAEEDDDPGQRIGAF